MKIKSSISRVIFVVCFTSLFFLFDSCKPKCEKHPDDPECVGENELITSLYVIAIDSVSGLAVDTFRFVDADGNGSPEVFDTIRLSANRTYRISLQFLNESVSPAEFINPEIQEEKNDHFISFSTHNVNMGVTYIDFDTNVPPLPLGLETWWVTGSAASGHIQIVLRHQPGIKDGTATPGDTDVSVEFPIQLQ